jgi:hypothetical protein
MRGDKSVSAFGNAIISAEKETGSRLEGYLQIRYGGRRKRLPNVFTFPESANWQANWPQEKTKKPGF